MLKLIRSELLGKFPGLTHGFAFETDKDKKLDTSYDFGLDKIQTVNQVHGDSMLYVKEYIQTKPQCDSIYTQTGSLGMGVYTADCVPIIYYIPEKNLVGAIHSGWRGTLNRIVYKTFEHIKGEFKLDNSDVYVSLGPSIEGDCYEIGEDVANMFMKEFPDHQEYLSCSENNRFKLDLEVANIKQLEDSGIKKIETIKFCTYCDSTLPSYRREGNSAGRILSFIGLI